MCFFNGMYYFLHPSPTPTSQKDKDNDISKNNYEPDGKEHRGISSAVAIVRCVCQLGGKNGEKCQGLWGGSSP